MRTFIFGAGASIHAGYPLASEMWPALSGWVLQSCPPEPLFQDVVAQMNAQFDVSQPFESVLTDLQQRIEILVRKASISEAENFEKHNLLQLSRAAEYMVCCYFNAIRTQPAELYEKFASEVLAPGDTVITFNYDVALDRALRRSGKWTIRDGYGFEIERLPLECSMCRLLKLHGSTNWRGELFGGMEGFIQWNGPSLGERPVVDRAEFEYLGYNGMSDERCHNGRAWIGSLIMPTEDKRFYKQTSHGLEWQKFWDFLWRQAEYALRMSNKIYIVGYSLPEYDTRARELLAKAPANAQVNVCCRTATHGIVEALKKLGLMNTAPCKATTFADFLCDKRRAADCPRS
jgi:hypothetical protein